MYLGKNKNGNFFLCPPMQLDGWLFLGFLVCGFFLFIWFGFCLVFFVCWGFFSLEFLVVLVFFFFVGLGGSCCFFLICCVVLESLLCLVWLGGGVFTPLPTLLPSMPIREEGDFLQVLGLSFYFTGKVQFSNVAS